MMKRLLALLLPMQVLEPHYFTDVRSGRPVGLYRERFTGRVVMAGGRRSLFRVHAPYAQRKYDQ